MDDVIYIRKISYEQKLGVNLTVTLLRTCHPVALLVLGSLDPGEGIAAVVDRVTAQRRSTRSS